MKKMSKQDVETVIFENAKTGEALEFQHEQHKAEYGAKHFWKADKKFFELLSTFSAAESKVVAYILQKTQPTKNEFIGAYKTIARKLECDVTTVRNTFKKMMENDMLAKTDDERIWMLNPRLLVKGDIIVKARLMSKYDSLLGRPLSDWIIVIERICNIISVHRNHPPVARPVNPSAIRFLVCGLCCGCVVSAC